MASIGSSAPDTKRQRRSGGGLDRVGDVGRIDMQFGVQVSGQGATGGQFGSDSAGGGRGKALSFVQGGQLGQFGFRAVSEFALFLRDLRTLAVPLAGD
jgi:hypothetical protein